MEKKLVAVFAFLLVALWAHAQFQPAYKHAVRYHVGARAGVGFSSYDFDESRVITMPTGGIAVDYRVASVPVYVESGLYYMDMGTRGKVYYTDGYTVDEFTSHNHSVLMPMVGSYHFYIGDKVTLQPFTGFYVSYGFGNDKTDFGLREGVGVAVNNFYANMGVNYGLVDQLSEPFIGDGHHRSFFMTVGFNFIGGR